MRKGISIAIVVFILAVLLIAINSIFTRSLVEASTFTRGVTETAILQDTNVMELLKRSLQQSLKYSYYQASYELTKGGGNLQTLPTWRIYGDTSGYPADFKSLLESKTLEIFKEYVSELSDKSITIDEYNNIEIEKRADAEHLNALSGGSLKISKSISSASYEIMNNADVFITIPTKTLTLFEIGKRDFVDNDAISSEIRNAEQLIPSQCRQIETTACETIVEAICNGELANICPNVDGNFKNDAIEKINALDKTENGLITDVSINDIDMQTSHSLAVDEGIGTQDPSSCGCKPGKERIVTVEIPCSEEELMEDPDKICTTEETVCDEYYTKKPVTCNFSYFGSAKVMVNVEDASNVYPVYDQTVDMRNIILSFFVISSNDYSQKLIS